MPGCMLPSRVFQYIPGIPGQYPAFCTIDGSYCTADHAMAGCATVGEDPGETVPVTGPGVLLCENENRLVQESGDVIYV